MNCEDDKMTTITVTPELLKQLNGLLGPLEFRDAEVGGVRRDVTERLHTGERSRRNVGRGLVHARPVG